MTAYYSKSSNLVLRSLGYGTAYLAYYRVYRWLESRQGPITESDSELADDMGACPACTANAVSLLCHIGLLAVSLTPERRRVITVVREYPAPVVHILKGMRTSSRTPVVPLGLSFEKGGFRGFSSSVTDCGVDHGPACGIHELLTDELQENNARAESYWVKYSPERQAQITALIDKWRVDFGYLDKKHTKRRRTAVNARLEDGYTPEQLETVLAVACADPWWRGDNDRRTPYDQLERLFHNAERVDLFLAKAGNRRGAGKVDRVRTDLAVTARPVEEERF